MDLLRPILDATGNRIMFPDGSILPARCAICNKVVNEPPKRIVLRWTPVGHFSSHLGLVGVAIAYFTAKKGVLYAHFCPWHALWRRLVLVISGAVVLSCWGLTLLIENRGRSLTNFLPYVGMILGSIVFFVGLFNSMYFRATEISGTHMEVKGFGKPFYQSLKIEEILTLPELSASQVNRVNRS